MTRAKATTRRRIGATDVQVTALGLGGGCLGNLYDRVEEGTAEAAVAAALARGVSYFDTAPYYGYGLAEERLGRALEDVERDAVVISSKVGRLLVPRPGAARSDQGFVDARPFDPVFDYSYQGVMRSFESSLERLRTDRIDVLLLHDIGARTHGAAAHATLFAEAMRGGVRAMQRLKEGGAVRAIGLGVNEWEVCVEALDHADFDCFLLAGRYTLLEQGALAPLLGPCLERQASIIAGGPFNSGLLVEEGGERHYDYGVAPPEVVARAEKLRAVCRDHGVPLAAAALQFPLLHPAVAAVIPGARSAAEVEANAAWLELALPASLWADLKSTGLLDPAAPVGAA